ncbi:MAG TPA: hypothetical protein VFY10_07015 [Dehalococcoidia bacterium]|nr:hypothetical protein [Dehalococcoidia bacterium]
MTTATPIRHPARKMLYKSCPRCHGDLIVDRESEGPQARETRDFVCLQCGRNVAMRLVDLPGSMREHATAA